MFYYLYYKLYQASLKSSLKDIPEFMTAVSFGTLIIINLLVVNALLAKLDLGVYIFSKSAFAKLFPFIIIGLTLIYFNKKRRKSILDKYSEENRRERIWGNVIVSVYVAVSFLSIFVIGLFKAGKL